MDMDSWAVDILKLSVQEWEALLDDSSIMTAEASEMLLFVYDEPGHRATATDIARHLNVHWNKVTSINRDLAKRILVKLGRAPQRNEEGGNRFWNIVFAGDETGVNDSEGHFWWVIRPNLVEAIRKWRGNELWRGEWRP
ncbi:MAG: hypothetical protein LBS62_00985 [Clostridiales bacterium]|jgi:5-methylcytosine-specific restriction protein A|nr:hypothetical protein [Clostridiales bacterium]